MRVFGNRNAKKGYTLGEVLIVVAITMILASIGFVSIFTYQRKLKLKEMNDTARSIFITAQNEISAQLANGKDWVNHDSYELCNPIPSDASEDETVSYIKYDGKGNVPSILPFGSIDETIRKDQHYIIEVCKDTGFVHGVFYTDNTMGFDDYTYLDRIRKMEESDVRKKARNHKKDGKQWIIGYYGGETLKQDRGVSIQPTVKVMNDETLRVEVKLEDSTFSKLNVVNVQARIANDKKSKFVDINVPKEKLSEYIEVKENQATITLDTITKKNGHFGNLFDIENFTPGMDVEVRLVLEGQDKNGKKSLPCAKVVKMNSAFDSIDDNKIYITNVRHLQNLSEEVSNVNFDTLKRHQVELVNPLYWKKPNDAQEDVNSFVEKVKKTQTNKQAKVVVYPFDGKGKTKEQADKFLPIKVSQDLTVHGNKNVLHEFEFYKTALNLENVPVSYGSGLFGCVKGNVKLENVLIENPVLILGTSEIDNKKKVIGSKTSVGSFIGYVADGGNVTIDQCGVYASDLEHYENNQMTGRFTGGLIGMVDNANVSIKDSFASIRMRARNVSGGLVAKVRGNNTSLTIENSYSSGALDAKRFNHPIKDKEIIEYNNDDCMNIEGGNFAGGLIGRLHGNVSYLNVNNCYSTASIQVGNSKLLEDEGLEKPTNSFKEFVGAGGLVGALEAHNKDIKIQDSYFVGNVFGESKQKYANDFHLGMLVGSFVEKVEDEGDLTNKLEAILAIFNSGPLNSYMNADNRNAFGNTVIQESLANAYKACSYDELVKDKDGKEFKEKNDSRPYHEYTNANGNETMHYPFKTVNKTGLPKDSDKGGMHVGDWIMGGKVDVAYGLVYYEKIGDQYYFDGWLSNRKDDKANINNEKVHIQNTFNQEKGIKNNVEWGYVLVVHENYTKNEAGNENVVKIGDQALKLVGAGNSIHDVASRVEDNLQQGIVNEIKAKSKGDLNRQYLMYKLPKEWTKLSIERQYFKMSDKPEEMKIVFKWNGNDTALFMYVPYLAKSVSVDEKEPKTYFEIRHKEQYEQLVALQNSNQDTLLTNEAITIHQTVDLDLSNVGMLKDVACTLDGSYAGSGQKPFSSYDIKGLQQAFVGNNKGTVKNFNFVGCKSTGAGVVGDNAGLIENCNYVNSNAVSGIANLNGQNGTIRNCHVWNTNPSKEMIVTNGIVESNEGIIDFCEVSGTNAETVQFNGGGQFNINTENKMKVTYGIARENMNSIQNCRVRNIGSSNLYATKTWKETEVSSIQYTDSSTLAYGIVETNRGEIVNPLVEECLVLNSGIANTNFGTIKGMKSQPSIVHSVMKENGLLERNDGNVENVDIVNSLVGKVGAVKTNAGIMSGCQLFSNKELFETYLSKYFDLNTYTYKGGIDGSTNKNIPIHMIYEPNELIGMYSKLAYGDQKDDLKKQLKSQLNQIRDASVGDLYTLMSIGNKGTDAIGFVAYNEKRISNCSVTAKLDVLPNNNRAFAIGFAVNNEGEIDCSYANTEMNPVSLNEIVMYTGFVYRLEPNSTTKNCFAIGDINHPEESRLDGFVYEVNGTPNISNNYCYVYNGHYKHKNYVPFSYRGTMQKNGNNYNYEVNLSEQLEQDESRGLFSANVEVLNDELWNVDGYTRTFNEGNQRYVPYSKLINGFPMGYFGDLQIPLYGNYHLDHPELRGKNVFIEKIDLGHEPHRDGNYVLAQSINLAYISNDGYVDRVTLSDVYLDCEMMSEDIIRLYTKEKYTLKFNSLKTQYKCNVATDAIGWSLKKNYIPLRISVERNWNRYSDDGKYYDLADFVYEVKGFSGTLLSWSKWDKEYSVHTDIGKEIVNPKYFKKQFNYPIGKLNLVDQNVFDAKGTVKIGQYGLFPEKDDYLTFDNSQPIPSFSKKLDGDVYTYTLNTENTRFIFDQSVIGKMYLNIYNEEQKVDEKSIKLEYQTDEVQTWDGKIVNVLSSLTFKVNARPFVLEDVERAIERDYPAESYDVDVIRELYNENVQKILDVANAYPIDGYSFDAFKAANTELFTNLENLPTVEQLEEMNKKFEEIVTAEKVAELNQLVEEMRNKFEDPTWQAFMDGYAKKLENVDINQYFEEAEEVKMEAEPVANEEEKAIEEAGPVENEITDEEEH